MWLVDSPTHATNPQRRAASALGLLRDMYHMCKAVLIPSCCICHGRYTRELSKSLQNTEPEAVMLQTAAAAWPVVLQLLDALSHLTPTQVLRATTGFTNYTVVVQLGLTYSSKGLSSPPQPRGMPIICNGLVLPVSGQHCDIRHQTSEESRQITNGMERQTVAFGTPQYVIACVCRHVR
jgi:hypothetical protein